MSVANMMLHGNRWKEVQRDMAILMCEMLNCRLRTIETSVGQRGRKNCLIFRLYLKTISGRKKIHKVSKIWEQVYKILNPNLILRIRSDPYCLGACFTHTYGRGSDSNNSHCRV